MYLVQGTFLSPNESTSNIAGWQIVDVSSGWVSMYFWFAKTLDKKFLPGSLHTVVGACFKKGSFQKSNFDQMTHLDMKRHVFWHFLHTRNQFSWWVIFLIGYLGHSSRSSFLLSGRVCRQSMHYYVEVLDWHCRYVLCMCVDCLQQRPSIPPPLRDLHSSPRGSRSDCRMRSQSKVHCIVNQGLVLG